MHNGKKFKTKCNAYGLLKLFRHTHSSYIKVCCVLVKEGFEGGGGGKGERRRGKGEGRDPRISFEPKCSSKLVRKGQFK